MNFKTSRLIFFCWILTSLIISAFSFNINIVCYKNSVSDEFNNQSLKHSQVEDHWKRTWDNGSDYLFDMAIDSQDNIYLYGYTILEEYSTEMCLLKYNNSGNLQWMQTWKNPRSYWGSPIAIDSSDNVYITGNIFNPISDSIDISLMKFNSNGTLLLNRTWGREFEDGGICIALDPSNNIYIAGYTSNYISEFVYEWDAVLIKFNSSGDKLWAIGYGDNNDQEYELIEIDSLGNIYTLLYDFSEYDGAFDVYIHKFNSSGVLEWSKLGELGVLQTSIVIDSEDNLFFIKEWGGIRKINSSGSQIWQRTNQGFIFGCVDSVVDPLDNLYILGTHFEESFFYQESLAWNSIKKYDNEGNLKWQKRGVIIPTEVWSKIVLDSSGNIYVAGEIRNETLSQSDLLLIKNPQLSETELPPELYALTVLIVTPLGIISAIIILSYYLINQTKIRNP